MNAPITIRLDENEHEAALRHAISIHCPNEGELSMACRVDIATMRDVASSGAFRASRGAAALLCEAARVATISVYAPATDRQLMRTRTALRMTIDAARALERAGIDGR